MTQKKKIVDEYDRLISTGAKVNKAKFAQSHGLARSSLQTLLEPKNRELFTKAKAKPGPVDKQKLVTCLAQSRLFIIFIE